MIVSVSVVSTGLPLYFGYASVFRASLPRDALLAWGVPAALGAVLAAARVAGAAEAGAAGGGGAEPGAAEAGAADGGGVGATTCGAADGTGALRLAVAAGVGVAVAPPQAASRALSDTAP